MRLIPRLGVLTVVLCSPPNRTKTVIRSHPHRVPSWGSMLPGRKTRDTIIA